MTTIVKDIIRNTFQDQYSYHINLQPTTDNQKLYEKSIKKHYKNSKNDSGFDLYVPNDIIIPSNKIRLIDMGVKCSVYKYKPHNSLITMSESHLGKIRKEERLSNPSPYYLYPRSSVSKRGIILANSVGIIDCGYRGNLMAAFYNINDEPILIKKGDRIVQICMPDLSYNFDVQIVKLLDKTERGEGGLGSTGK